MVFLNLYNYQSNNLTLIQLSVIIMIIIVGREWQRMVKRLMQVLLMTVLVFTFSGFSSSAEQTTTSSEVTPQACFFVPPCDWTTIGF